MSPGDSTSQRHKQTYGPRRCRFNRRGGTRRAAAVLSPASTEEKPARTWPSASLGVKAAETRPGPSVLQNATAVRPPASPFPSSYGTAGRRSEKVSSRSGSKLLRWGGHPLATPAACPPPAGNPQSAMRAHWRCIRRPDADRSAQKRGQALVKRTPSSLLSLTSLIVSLSLSLYIYI